MSSEEIPRVFWGLCVKLSSSFVDTLCSDLKKSIGLEVIKTGLFADEVVILNIWILHKALPGNEIILTAIGQKYISNMGTITGNQQDIHSIEQWLLLRLEQYFSDWDDLSGTNQSVLSMSMLENILHGEDFDKKKLTNFLLLFSIQTHIFSAITAVREMADQFTIATDESNSDSKLARGKPRS